MASRITIPSILVIIISLFNSTISSQQQSTSSAQTTHSPVSSRTIVTSRRWFSKNDPVDDTQDLSKRARIHLHSHLRSRSPNNDLPTGISKNCQIYYSANTNHAVCNGDRTMMCLGGCTGGVVAQNCRLNSTSPFTTETCSIGFSQTSETAYVCNTPQGAYSCSGPSTGDIACHNCVPTPNGALPPNVPPQVINSTAGQSSGPGSANGNQTESSAASTKFIYAQWPNSIPHTGLIGLFLTVILSALV